MNLFGGEDEIPKRTRARTESDEIRDAMCEEFGLNPVTKLDFRALSRIVSDLKAKGATPEMIYLIAPKLTKTWGAQSHTPRALERNWDLLVGGAVDDPTPGKIEAEHGKYDKLS